MRLLSKSIEKDGSGYIVLKPEEIEDMWHAYNLIFVGDQVTATTVRRVMRSTNTGSTASERLRMTLTISVEKIEFEPDAGVLRLNGPNCTESQHIKMGAYHTIDLELKRKFSLAKAYWDSVVLERVNDACDPTKHADLAAVIMSEGQASVCLITNSMTLVRGHVESTIPRKRKSSSALHDKALQKFFENTMQAILRHVNFDVVKCVIVASPGFVKDQFYEYMNLEAVRKDIKILQENKSKFLLVHSSSGDRSALREVLSDPGIVEQLADTKAAGEVNALNRFYAMMKSDPDRAFYGLSDIVAANERLAIQELFITDELFRSSDVKKRKQYIHLVESVRENGGTVQIFSTLHVSGEQLKQLGGLAAILRFPLPDIDEERGSESEEEEEEKEKEKELDKDKKKEVADDGDKEKERDDTDPFADI